MIRGDVTIGKSFQPDARTRHGTAINLDPHLPVCQKSFDPVNNFVIHTAVPKRLELELERIGSHRLIDPDPNIYPTST